MRIGPTIPVFVVLTSLLCAQEEPDEPDLPGGELPVLEETVVTPMRGKTEERFSPRSVSEVTGETARERNYRRTPGFLRDVPGVMVQSSNLGGGAPFVRGLTGNQVLVLVDGIRFNNSTTRFGPNQALNTIDPAIIDRIEVVRGSGSVLYGSDAIGGVVQVFTKKAPKLVGEGMAGAGGGRLGGGIYGQYASALDGGSVSAEFGGIYPDFDFLGVGSMRDYGDLYEGRDMGTARDITGYDQFDVMGTFTHHLDPDRRIRYSLQFTRQNDVPRTDRLRVDRNPTFVPDAERRFAIQQREMYYVAYEDDEVGGLADDLSFSLSFQRHKEERRRTRQTGPPPFTPRDEVRREKDVVNVFGLTTVLHKHLDGLWGEEHDFTYGLDLFFDYVESRRNDLTPSTGATQSKVGRFADGSTYLSLGVFVQDEITISEGWHLVPGLRYSVFSIDADLEDSAGGPSVDVDNTFSQFTWGLSTVHALGDAFTLIGGVATGFRAPNIDDSTISGGFALGEEVPNGDLDPEESLQVEAGLRLRDGGWYGEVFGFFTRIDDVIQRVETTPGSGEFQRQNVGEADIYGVEAQLGHRWESGWSIWGWLSWTRGRLYSDVDPAQDDVPFRRIPPLMGQVGVRYQEPLDARWMAEALVRFADEQTELHPDDIRDNRIGAGGTRGYVVFDLNARYDLGPHATLYASLENLLDLDYRVHGSGISGPGRNLVLGVELRF